MRIGNSKISSGSFILNAGYALSDKWKLKVFGGYNQKNGEAAGIFRYPSAINIGCNYLCTADTSSLSQWIFAFDKNGYKRLFVFCWS